MSFLTTEYTLPAWQFILLFVLAMSFNDIFSIIKEYIDELRSPERASKKANRIAAEAGILPAYHKVVKREHLLNDPDALQRYDAEVETVRNAMKKAEFRKQVKDWAITIGILALIVIAALFSQNGS